MDKIIEAIKMVMITSMENPMKTYLSRGIVKRDNDRYYIFVDNAQIAAKYADNAVQGHEVRDFFMDKLGIEVGVRHIKDMTRNDANISDDLDSDEIEIIKAYRRLDARQKELIKRIIDL